MKINRNSIKKRTNSKVKTSVLMTLLALSSSQVVYAGEDSLWQLSFGVGAAAAPKYEGAKKYDANPVIIADVVFMDHFFLSTLNGAGVHFINHPNWNLGIIANYVSGRKEKDSRYLKGLGDIDSYIDAGIFAAWRPEPFSVSLQAFKGSKSESGLHITAAVKHSMTFGQQLQIEQSLSTTYANARYNNLYFGINRKQSLNSRYNYQEYQASGGIKDVSYSITASYPITDKFSATLVTEYKYLTGPAAKSPLVKQGSRHQGLIGAGIIYTF